MAYVPTLVSERQPGGHWDRCVESSICMLTDKLSMGSWILNARKLEAVVEKGPNGETSVPGNLVAIHKVYPSFPVAKIKTTRNTDTMESLLFGGYGYAIVGNYHNLPAHFTRWDSDFAKTNPAGHATYIQIDGPTGRRWDSHNGKFVWWMDPLATPGYRGEWMELATMFGFLNGSINAYGLEGSVSHSGGGHPIPVPPAMKYNFSPLPGPSGTFVTGSNPLIAYINLETGVPIRAPNKTYTIAHPIRLDPAIPGGAPGADRRTAYLIGPASVAVAVLASDGVFTPSSAAPSLIAVTASFSDGSKQTLA